LYVVTGTLPGYGSSIQIAAAAFRLRQLLPGAATAYSLQQLLSGAATTSSLQQLLSDSGHYL
jgi:hypothetical protein